MTPEPLRPEPTADPEWAARLRYWRRKLGRIRLGVEPVDEQLDRYRRITLLLTAIAAGVALIIFSLFTIFRRPDVGAVLVLILFAPVVAVAWFDHAMLRLRVSAYLRELHDHEARSH